MARAGTANRLHAIAGLPGIELLEADFSGQPFGRHAHDAFSIGAIDAGVGGYTCRGVRHALPRHTLSLMNPDEAHTGYAVSDRLRYKMLYVREDLLARYLNVKAVRGFRDMTPTDPDGAVAAGLTRLLAAMTEPDHAGARLAVETAACGLLSDAFERHGGFEERPLGREAEAVRKTKAHILDMAEAARAGDAMAETNLGLAALADDLGLHPNYLLQSFTRQVGLSPYAYWLVRRVEAAKALLAEGRRAVDVAYQLGFCDHAHFIRTFRKATGVTPGAYTVHGAV